MAADEGQAMTHQLDERFAGHLPQRREPGRTSVSRRFPDNGFSPVHRIDCRVLLLAAKLGDPEHEMWRDTLTCAGIPFDVHVPGVSRITDDRLSDGEHARYQALIAATGGLLDQVSSPYMSSLSADEREALARFERRFSIRRITGFAYPSPQYGLGSPTAAGAVGDLTAALTAAGRSIFGELRGVVPVDPAAYRYQTRPLNAGLQSLVTGPDGSVLVGIFTHPDDGRQNMVCTVSANSRMIHAQLLRDGMLRWVTRGVHLGHRRHYLSLQVDDVFLANDSWRNGSCTTIPARMRMGADDVAATVAWSQKRGLRPSMAFNAHGADPDDEFTATLLRHKDSFAWVNHTFGHLTLDAVDLPTLVSEIRLNVEFARAHGLPMDPTELITGEHSGLRNQYMPGALAKTGIRWIADDNSRRPMQEQLGTALTVPRHPTNIYCNVATCADQLHQYDHLSASGSEERTVAPPARGTTWSEFIGREADMMLFHVLGNDPRPHYVHQSNLSDDRIAFKLLDEVLARVNEYLSIELTHPSLAQAGEELSRQSDWHRALEAGRVSAYLHGGKVHVRARDALRVPITGAQEVGSDHGPCRSGWSEPVEPEHGDVAFALA